MNYYIVSNELYHHGILGQKWGIRRYQNPDGSLTAEGKKRYYNSDNTLNEYGKKRIKKEIDSKKLLLNESSRKLPFYKQRVEANVDFAIDVYNNYTSKRYNDKTKMDKKSDHDRGKIVGEDWTIGWTTVADLARRGYSKKQIFDIIDKCKEYEKTLSKEERSKNVSVLELADDNGSDCKGFAEDCCKYYDKLNRDEFTRRMNEESFKRFNEQAQRDAFNAHQDLQNFSNSAAMYSLHGHM